MSSRDLFKQAGIEDYVMPTLTGAGIGAAGFGAANLFGQRDKKMSASERLKGALMSALKGGALGGAAGAGVQGGKDIYNTLTGDPENIKKILAQAKAPLDQSTHETNHPVEAVAGRAAGINPLATATAGAGVGGYYVNRLRAAGEQLAQSIHGKSTGDNALNLEKQLGELGPQAGKMQTDAIGKLNGVVNHGANSKLTGDSSKWQAFKKLLDLNAKEAFPEGFEPPVGPGGFNPNIKKLPKMERVMAGLTPDEIHSRLSKFLGQAGHDTATHQGNIGKYLEEIKSPKMTALKQYGKGMGIGAGVGFGAQELANMGFKTYMNGKYDQDQLNLWNTKAGK